MSFYFNADMYAFSYSFLGIMSASLEFGLIIDSIEIKYIGAFFVQKKKILVHLKVIFTYLVHKTLS